MIEGYKIHRAHIGFEDHIAALNASEIGKSIVKYTEKKKVYAKEAELPKNILGQYVASPIGTGLIEYAKNTSALVLAHEGRHAWQYGNVPSHLMAPKSAEDYVLVRRFLEADARAVHFACTLEILANLGTNHSYGYYLEDILSENEKSLYENDSRNIADICNNRTHFLQVTREAFDLWVRGGLGGIYDSQISQNLSAANTSKLSRKFWVETMGKGAFYPSFVSKEQDPELPQQLSKILGRLTPQSNDNYLLDTNGPSLDDPFYTRICNYRVEREIEKLHNKL